LLSCTGAGPRSTPKKYSVIIIQEQWMCSRSTKKTRRQLNSTGVKHCAPRRPGHVPGTLKLNGCGEVGVVDQLPHLYSRTSSVSVFGSPVSSCQGSIVNTSTKHDSLEDVKQMSCVQVSVHRIKQVSGRSCDDGELDTSPMPLVYLRQMDGLKYRNMTMPLPKLVSS
jgi:hypothetical protein